MAMSPYSIIACDCAVKMAVHCWWFIRTYIQTVLIGPIPCHDLHVHCACVRVYCSLMFICSPSGPWPASTDEVLREAAAKYGQDWGQVY